MVAETVSLATRNKFGRWLRVEATTKAALANSAFFDAEHRAAVINLDNVTRVEPYHGGAVVAFVDLTEVAVTDDFELICIALMASELPMPWPAA